jgi:adenine deaminase
MVSPSEFAKAVVPRGTTTVIADPHEIANVRGLKGIDYILSFSGKIPLNIYIMLPSCVPATHLETSGAVLGADELSKYHDHPNVLGLGEFMNYPGVINTFDDVMEKLELFQDKIIDGHAPMVSGMDLCAYRAAGVTSEHECTTVKEALEKLRMGMYIMIREGSATKNLLDLMPLLNKFNERFCIFSTDDRHPDDLINEGHIDNMVKMLVREQGNIVRAVRLASKNTAEYFGLKDLGSIAPGYRADMIVIEDFTQMKIREVYKDGKLVAQDGKALFEGVDIKNESIFSSVSTDIDAQKIVVRQGSPTSVINTIEIIPSQIITRRVKVKPFIKDGLIESDVQNDILKFCVFERHNATGNTGIGFVKGLGLKNGAIGTSVSHDSHNINVIGTNDKDILKCAEVIRDNNGGQAVVCEGKVLEILPLPIAGLMSPLSLEEVSEKIKSLHAICGDLGVSIKDPFITIAFLALPVIPDIKLTDKGLVDVTRFEFIDLVEEI